MLEFEQYKLDLGAMEKDIAELYEALGIENEKKKLAELEEKSAAPDFYSDMEASQKTLRAFSDENARFFQILSSVPLFFICFFRVYG